MVPGDHIVDILGVGTKEDAYTNLVCYALNASPGFRSNLLEVLGQKDHPSWQARSRISIQTKTAKNVPDLILFSNKLNAAVVIENKVLSGENADQLRRYCADENLTQMAEALKLDCNPDYAFFLLTLDGVTPSAPKFRPLSYMDIVKAFPSAWPSGNLVALMTELRERVDEFSAWPLPMDSTAVMDYLSRTPRLVTPMKAFITLVEHSICQTPDFSYEYGVTGNRGSAFIPLCQWDRPTWRGTKYTGETTPGDQCWEIHYELQWDTRWNYLALYLHYHAHPYMTRAELGKKGEAFAVAYQRARTKSADYIRRTSPDLWVVDVTPLRICYHQFDHETSTGEFRDRIRAATDTMTPLVDRYVADTK